jgi:hypothetical protein
VVLNRQDELKEGAGKKREQLEAAEKVLKIVKDVKFWEDTLRYVNQSLGACKLLMSSRMQIHLEPLARAQNVTEDVNVKLYHVLVIFGQLYFDYGHLDIEPAVQEQVRKSLDMRWQKSDQDVFIMAIVLNPYLWDHCFNRQVTNLTPMGLSHIAKQLYMRMFWAKATKVLPEFFGAFHDYLDNQCEFFDECLMLWDFKAQHEVDISVFQPLLCTFHVTCCRVQKLMLFAFGRNLTTGWSQDKTPLFDLQYECFPLSHLLQVWNPHGA